MATKTAVLNEDSHKYLKRVQSILYDKYNVEMHLPDIISHIIQDEAIKDADNMVKKIVDKKNSFKNDFEYGNEKIAEVIKMPG